MKPPVLFGLDALNVQLELHFFPYNQASAIQRLTPDHSKIFAIEAALRVEPCSNIPPRVVRDTVKIPDQGDGFRDAVQRQISPAV